MKIQVKHRKTETEISFEAETQQEERDLKEAVVESCRPTGEYFVVPSVKDIVQGLERLGYVPLGATKNDPPEESESKRKAQSP